LVLNKNARLSARIFGNVLNFPLYDADCCPAAREHLAVGNIDGAIAEWQRLADLGSGTARCVLAYLRLVGAPSMPIDLEEARRIALSAVSGARGYANYILACIALKEKQNAECVKYLLESRKAGFVPAGTYLALLTLRGASKENVIKIDKILRQSAKDGHWPALVQLAGLYLSGQLGIARRVLGLGLVVPAFIRFWLALRFQVFSIHCFQYFASVRQPLFNEEGIRRLQRHAYSAPRVSCKTVVRWTHAITAIVATVVLVRQSDAISRHHGSTTVPEMAGWALLAAWPYGLSYLFASTVTARRLMSTLVQSLLLCLITTLVCSAYLGHLLGTPLSTSVVAETTGVQAFLLLSAFGLGENAAQHVEEANVGMPLRWPPIASVHVILGLVAAGACLARPNVWRLDYWTDQGFNVASEVLLAMLPYLVGVVMAWQLVMANGWRPWAYICVLLAGTALALVNNSEIWTVQPGILGIVAVFMVQSIGFVLAAEWAVEGTPE
jgi:hypothetical protein